MTARERAQLARRLKEMRAPEWEAFLADWMCINTVYNAFGPGSERDRLMEAVDRLVQPDDANALLARFEDEIRHLCALPPGDMRKQGKTGFRTRATEDMAVVADPSMPAPERLARLLAVTYQIRCNLAHGDKDPDVDRDRELVRHSRKIVGHVVPLMIHELGR